MLNLREDWECILYTVAEHKPLVLQLGLKLNETDFFNVHYIFSPYVTAEYLYY